MKKIMLLIIAVIMTAGIIYISVDKEKILDKDVNGFNGKIKEFDITAMQFEFNPSIIKVNKGDLVKIKIKSIDVEHSIVIPDFEINENLSPGEDIKIEFIADKKGEFSFFCGLYCGEGHKNMNGRLIVD